ncbi:cell division protein ZapA [Clostridium lacusfryxellense]|uniref:cell division protein ZapA n=1 Tax=Clostridium lacusfryxellense TaxID=205328 RepID=UPI001C0CC609|nr:cell division protein ZapA [Clostridium lacusfryxellense]MBU3112051.1 cell division protein ZapA [Clostridium lacusfryxellense]
MNIVTIKINGIEYNLKGDEREEYLHKVASYVDKKIKNIMSNNEKLSTSSAAILTALNLGDDMFKSKLLNTEFSSKEKSLEIHDKELTEQLEGLKKQLVHLEDYNQELLNKCKTTDKTEYVKALERENIDMQQQLDIMQETSKNCIEENRKMEMENKEIKFKLQSYKYKIIDSQNKLIEYQISLAKQKKINNPLLSSHKK